MRVPTDLHAPAAHSLNWWVKHRYAALVTAGAVVAHLQLPVLFAQTQSGEQTARSGKELYLAACAACHAADGRGASQVMVGFDTPLPDFTDCRFASREPDPDWVTVVHEGGPVRGFSEIMPAFGEALTVEEIQSIVSYTRGFCREPAWPRGELNLPRPLITQSFRSSPEGSIAAQLTFGNGVQGGQGAHCQLTVSGFCECLSWGGNRKAAPKDRLISGPAYRLEPFEGVLEGVVDQVGVDLGGREIPVPKRPFDHQDIAGAAVEVGGKGVPQTVGTDALVDTRPSQPVLDSVGDLPCRQTRATIREKQRRALTVALRAALVQVEAQEGAQRGL